MIKLCSNRPESFGPHSKLHPNLPTTCFLDVIVVPLPTWLLLLATPLLIWLGLRDNKMVRSKGGGAPTKSRVAKVLSVIYYILIVAILAMESLEIARLAVAHLGIGLLPFVYVGVLIAGGLHAFSKTRFAMGASAVFWVALAAAKVIKLSSLVKEEGQSERVGVTSNYPLGDQVTDIGTMVGVELVLAVLEIVAR